MGNSAGFHKRTTHHKQSKQANLNQTERKKLKDPAGLILISEAQRGMNFPPAEARLQLHEAPPAQSLAKAMRMRS